MDSDEYLQLAGIQHYSFCQRQWALIHIEGRWEDNILTYGGHQLHHKVDNPFDNETRSDTITTRSVPVVSHHLKLYGIADMVEFIRTDEGVKLPGRSGFWQPYPVEYKHGQSKMASCDRVQLCAQAVCLEEMFSRGVSVGFIFYGRTKRRETVLFDDDLRAETLSLVADMHRLFLAGTTPQRPYDRACEKCSLIDVCQPRLANRRSVDQYLNECL